MITRSLLGFSLVPFVLALLLAGCGDDDVNNPMVEILDPEPAGAPSALANGRLSCLGMNAPPAPAGTNLTLPGYVRAFADPTNTSRMQPAAQAEAFDADGTSLGMAGASTSDGRVAVSVPIRAEGFTGHVRATATGFVPVSLYSSRPYTSTATAGWAWMPTPTELTEQATMAGETLMSGRGVLVGAVHDCDVFGVGNAVVRWGTSTDGVTYYDGFAPSTSATYTAASGRFAIPNVPPGPVRVEAYGRIAMGGPLVLLSRADVVVTADEITAVDLEPRVGLER